MLDVGRTLEQAKPVKSSPACAQGDAETVAGQIGGDGVKVNRARRMARHRWSTHPVAKAAYSQYSNSQHLHHALRRCAPIFASTPLYGINQYG